MPKIKIDFIQEGMVVGSDVKNIDNMLLVPAGSALTERQINILKAWGVIEVEVIARETGSSPLAKLPSEELDRLLTEVRERFWEVDETNPVFMEIFKLVLHRHVRSNADELVPV
jgi:hypothetical protein